MENSCGADDFRCKGGRPLNPERLRKLTENYVSSNEKIKKALGISRMPVSAREGLRRTLESFSVH